uniref:Caenorhabditis elegans ly-6-related family-containing protein n=1 Tax=Rhabditophanes sp. KR3021 TaxID=114890 RepID=A0AC35TT75_9BILA
MNVAARFIDSINKAKLNCPNYFKILLFIGMFLSFKLVLVRGNVVSDGSFYDPHIPSTHQDRSEEFFDGSNSVIDNPEGPSHFDRGFVSSTEMGDLEGYTKHHPKRPFMEDQSMPSRIDERIFGGEPISDTAKCYSCMSSFYGAVWPAISHVYRRPKNFTNKCNDKDISNSNVPTTSCSTICLQMSEDTNVGGVKIKGHIRGCLDDILINGFNQTIVRNFRWLHRDSCLKYRKRELLKLQPDESDDSVINVCSCYSDHCNFVSTIKPNSISLLLVLSTLFVTEFLFIR